MVTTWELWINLPTVTMNSREHWARKAEKVKALRSAAFLLARQQRIPALGKCQVSLTLYPKVRRTRDADNYVATLKPLCDGLVDAGVVADDHPALMTKHMPHISQRADKRGLMCLRVTQG